MKKVIIVGGGFAGVNLANRINKKLFDVTLVDKNNYNYFPPLLYQVATAFLEPANISYPFRKHFRRKSVNFRLGELKRINAPDREVVLDTGILAYDYLVIATGVTTNYFGLDNVKKNALPMKNLNDALQLRNHILHQLEKATITNDAAERNRLLTIVIAGAGPTGIEISGMLGDLRNNVLFKDYPELIGGPDGAEIYLVDGGDVILKSMKQRSQKYTKEELEKLGIRIRTNWQVQDYREGVVFFKNGKTIRTNTLIWAAGVSGFLFDGLPAECYGTGRRIKTDAFNQVDGVNNIYAIGDTSIQETDPRYPGGHPQLAQVAIQQGKNLATNLEAIERERTLRPFNYFDKGSMAIIGRNKAVVDLSERIQLNGFFAWCMWLFIHLVSLISRRNRFTTLYNWLTSYVSTDQPYRMIIETMKEKL